MCRDVVIVDYGAGNLASVCRAIENCGYVSRVSCDPEVITKADFLILPGVGAFGGAIESLTTSNLDEAIGNAVTRGGFLLGICLGMQLLFSTSKEFGENSGLGLIGGDVISIRGELSSNIGAKIPRIGWADVHQIRNAGHFFSTKSGTDYYYFAHSFFVKPTSAETVVGYCRYHDLEIPAVVAHENVTGMQFHPEKSCSSGLNALRSFLEQ